MSKNQHNFRDVTAFVKLIRNSLLGRDLKNPLRFEPEYSGRSQPPPRLPDGPSHKLYGNYYYLRDARRQVETPKAIVGPEEVKKLADPGNKEGRLITTHGGAKPGKVYDPEYIRIEK